MRKLYLRKGEEKRIYAGHLWVFSNEVDKQKSPLPQFEAGEQVTLCRYDGKTLGSAYVNPASLICARLYSNRADWRLDGPFLQQRLATALQTREKYFPLPYYRLCFGEADYLPGLVIDRYGDYLVCQITTAGMEARRNEIIDALQSLVQPKGIMLKNDNASRGLEGLVCEGVELIGSVPPEIEIREGDCRFIVDPHHGQKTGWFYDQRENRLRLSEMAENKSVLDIFSYTGSWSVQAAKGGAKKVTAVDASQSALELLQRNAALNGVEEKVEAVQGDAFDVLRAMQTEKRKYDVIVLDPPAFIKRKKDLKQGLQAYTQINKLALSLLVEDGLFVSCSCSYHLSQQELNRCVSRAARGMELQSIYRGGQDMDHPVHPAIAETAYLDSLFYQRLS